MKKVFTFLLSAFVGLGAFAQNITAPANLEGREAEVIKRNYKAEKGPSFKIDYDQAESNAYSTGSTPPAADYRAYMFQVNTPDPSQSNTFHKVITVFDSIYDTGNSTGYPRNGISFNTMSLDSLTLYISHENNSGTEDSIIVRVINNSSVADPSTGTVAWEDTLFTSTSISPSGNWTGSNSLIALGLKIDQTFLYNETFSVELEYRGSLQDTLGIYAGFHDLGQMCGTSPLFPAASDFSSVRANSWAMINGYESFGYLPSNGSTSFFLDCNSNGSYDSGTDAWRYIENFGVVAKVTLDPTVVGTSESALVETLSQNQPNPFSATSIVNYSLSSQAKVSFEIYDITGKRVMTVNEGQQPAGNHRITIDGSNLDSGVYYYTLNADNERHTKKMVIVE